MQKVNTETVDVRYSSPVPWRKSPPSKNRALGTRIRANVSPPSPCQPWPLVGLFEQRADRRSNSIIRLKEAEHESDSNLRSDLTYVWPGGGPSKETTCSCAKDVCS